MIKKLETLVRKFLLRTFEGFEISYFVFIDQKNYLPFGHALDHKKAYDNDQGPNTGGMVFSNQNKFLEINQKN